MADEKFTTKVIHGLNVKKRVGDGRLYCASCGIALDAKGGCGTCKPTKKAWLEARIRHYSDTRHPQTLAQMVVELEESHDVTPEFDFEEEWPA